MALCSSLVVLVYAKYLPIFSSRLALRGGDQAVEVVVRKMRGEFKKILYALTVSIELFVLAVGSIAFHKMNKSSNRCIFALCGVVFPLVLWLCKRARDLFYFDKSQAFAAGDVAALGKEFDLSNRATPWEYRRSDYFLLS